MGFLVDDTTAALQSIAAYLPAAVRRAHHRHHRQRRQNDDQGARFTRCCRSAIATLHSESSYNNEIGLPLTLLKLQPEHERAVLEMGIYAQGEIALLCRLARPVVGVVTMIGPVHLERLGTMENIVSAKQELVEALPADGVAILNQDDERVHEHGRPHAGHAFSPTDWTPDADLWADKIASMGLEGIRFTLHYRRGAT